jgi:hypothetical protein
MAALGGRGSDRLVKVQGSCGHEKQALVHGFRPGPASMRNIEQAKTTPCWDCKKAQSN